MADSMTIDMRTCMARGTYGTGAPCGQPAVSLTPRGWMCGRHVYWMPIPTATEAECRRSIEEARVAHWQQSRL